ncbi:MAG: MnmC family methyltransferase [Planctomycetota bacterium]
MTGDGSPTLHSAAYDEDYHSRSGAWLEARERYVGPCQVVPLAAEVADERPVRILDIGFGLGWNVAWALLLAHRSVAAPRIEVVSLEKELLPWRTLEPLYAEFPPVEFAGRAAVGVRSAMKQLVEHKRVEAGGISLQLLLGEAEQEIRRAEGPFDCVFLDPFSPRRNPELWQQSFLEAIRERTRPGGVLSTYSAAAAVRIELLRARWSIGPGPRVGGKANGTVATHGTGTELPFEPFPAGRMRSLQRRADTKTGTAQDD